MTETPGKRGEFCITFKLAEQLLKEDGEVIAPVVMV
jgi:hypothetical protein